ncbi:hypothetical protein AX768_25240 [Burkholderia sp. PAMC 28687]|nr:hypothetical protein AX768_25240 [Burkholderia sp. PAMC 28687]
MWRNPIDKQTHVLGRISLAQAIHETQEANVIAEKSVATTTLAQRLLRTERTIEQLIKKMNMTGIAKTTAAARNSQDKVIAERFKGRAVETITTLEISDFLEEFKARGKMRWAQVMRTRLIEIFTKATALGWIDRNPATVTEKISVTVKRQRLTLEQFNKILEKAPEVAEWLPNMMLLALVSGQDRSTVASWPRNSVKDGEALVFRQKTKKWIAIPVALRMDAIGLSLADVIARCKSNVVSPYLIHHKRNNGTITRGSAVHLQTISMRFASARKLAGIPDENAPSFHEIRSLAKRTYMDQGGIDTKALLAHSDDATADLYANNRGIEPIKVKINMG